MMVPKSVSWHRMVFKYHGTELPRTKWRILGVLLLSCAVTWVEIVWEHYDFPDIHVVPFTLTGVALSIFLGFRNNAAYDRWWEGRKLWGAAVNTTRSFARQILLLIGEVPGGAKLTDAERTELAAIQKELVYRVVAWTHALRLALRDQDDLSELAPFIPAAEIESLKHQSNRPYAISQGTGERLRKLYDRGWIHPMHLPTLEASLVSLTDIQGACERIKGTPIPYSYNTLIHRIVGVYRYGLPFGLVSDDGMHTPVVVLVVSYAFFGIDTVGDEIEQPFGTDPNDLPLSAISRTIEVNLRQRIDDKDIPPLMRPVNEVLQ